MTRPSRVLRQRPGLSAGFTAIELAIAITLAALVGAVGISAYRTYVVRSQIAATVESSAPLMERIATAFHRAGVPPQDSAEAGLPAGAHDLLGPHVDSVAVSDGRIDIRFAAAAHSTIAGQNLYLTPFETATREIVWICGNAIPGAGLAPLGFAGGVRQAVQILTTIDARYLPASCR